LHTRTTFFQADRADFAELSDWLDDSCRVLTYFPLGLTDRSARTFRGGLLLLGPAPLSPSLRLELQNLCEILDPALCNAAEYGRVLSQYHKLETVRKTWEQLWFSV